MAWNDVRTLIPNRLAMLCFMGQQTGRWIGYVDASGICQWPDSVRGLRPAGWQEVSAGLPPLGGWDGDEAPTALSPPAAP